VSDRQARRQDISRTVWELDRITRRLADYLRTDPDAVAAEVANLMRACTALLTIIAELLERELHLVIMVSPDEQAPRP